MIFVWICKSCRMENEDKDSLCYMCGTKRPHTAPVRPSAQNDAPQNTSAPAEILPAKTDTTLFAETKPHTDTVPDTAGDFVFLWDEDDQTAGDEVIISDYLEPVETELQADESVVPAPTATAPPKADVNLFASVFNVPTQPEPTPSQAAQSRQDTPQTDFAAVFSDFLTAIETPSVAPIAPTMQNPAPPPVQPPAENIPLSKKEKKRQQREDSRKTVAGRVCSFLRTLFVAALCLWLSGFCLAAVMRLASASAGDIRFVFEELLYAFQQRLQEVFEYGLPGIFNELLSATGLL